jgi:hypothetical protein
MIAEAFTVTADDVIPSAATAMRERTRWLHNLTMALKPEFEKRGFCYPKHMSVEAMLVDPFQMIPGFISGETIPRARHARYRPQQNMTIFGGIVIVGMGPDGDFHFPWEEEDEKLPDDIDQLDIHVKIRADIPFENMAAGTLVHELCHAVLMPIEEGDHGPKWTSLATSMGLEPTRKPGSRSLPGIPERTPLADSNVGWAMLKMVKPLIEKIGHYPEAPSDFDINRDKLLNIYPPEVQAKLIA